MSRARRHLKRVKLRMLAIRYCRLRDPDDDRTTWCDFDTSQQCITQERYDRRIYGHPTGPRCCTPEHAWAAALWNNPARLWMGKGPVGYGPRYHRRYLNRRGRNR